MSFYQRECLRARRARRSAYSRKYCASTARQYRVSRSQSHAPLNRSRRDTRHKSPGESANDEPYYGEQLAQVFRECRLVGGDGQIHCGILIIKL